MYKEPLGRIYPGRKEANPNGSPKLQQEMIGKGINTNLRQSKQILLVKNNNSVTDKFFTKPHN
jgi:hypothetical protein